MLEKSRPSDVGRLKQGTTWLTGYTLAHIVSEIVRKAADNVGPDKVDNIAIDDVIREMSLDIEGLPTMTLADSEGTQVLQPYLKMISTMPKKMPGTRPTTGSMPWPPAKDRVNYSDRGGILSAPPRLVEPARAHEVLPDRIHWGSG